MSKNIAVHGGFAVKLVPMHTELLHILAEVAPRVVSYDQLISGLWGVDEPKDPLVNLITQVARLNKALRPLEVRVYNVRTRGYHLKLEEIV